MDPELYKAATSGNIELFSKTVPSNFFLKETLEKNSALHLAAKFEQKQFAEYMIIEYPHLLYQANSKGDTPLHIAASVGCFEIAKLLVTIQEDVEANKELLTMVNLEKDTALHIAVRNGHLKIVQLLIDKDKELASNQEEKKELAVNFINANGDSPLFLAVDRKLFVIACYILDNIAPAACSYQGRNKMNALHAAIIRHNLKSVVSILDGIRINIFLAWYRSFQNSIDFFKNYLVTCGSYNQGEEMLAIDFIQNYLVTGGSHNQVEEMLGTRVEVFMGAFIKQFPSAIKESDEFGWTPLHYAAFLGNTIAVHLLLKNNDEQMPHHVYYKDKEGLSALHIAAKEGHVYVMKQLIESFPDTCELLDDSGRTALHVAVENGMVGTVKYVLKTPSLEGLINVQDKEGNTSLHLAAFHGHYKIVNKLLDDRRVDKKSMNKEGFTAIKIIVSKMELTDFQKFRIATKLIRGGGLPSLEGVLRRENAENQNVEIKEQPYSESKKEAAKDRDREKIKRTHEGEQ